MYDIIYNIWNIILYRKFQFKNTSRNCTVEKSEQRVLLFEEPFF